MMAARWVESERAVVVGFEGEYEVFFFFLWQKCTFVPLCFIKFSVLSFKSFFQSQMSTKQATSHINNQRGIR